MSILRFSMLAFCLALPVSAALAQANLNVAQYSKSNELWYPPNLDTWIQTGASIGGEYNDKPFDPQHPGTVGVVQMEPTAYRYFREHKRYAEGTMFLLSFYQAESKSDPQLPGFVQGALLSQEIHVLDNSRFGQEGHAFFMFPTPDQQMASALPPGNVCVVCHMEHGKFNGTFAQFYPTLRALLGLGK